MKLYVEQGTTLTDTGAGVGIVDSITGITKCEVRITGEADHAGSTSMDERTDAFAAASELVLDLERAGRDCAETSEAAVATAGKGSIAPNARNHRPQTCGLRLRHPGCRPRQHDADGRTLSGQHNAVGAESGREHVDRAVPR